MRLEMGNSGRYSGFLTYAETNSSASQFYYANVGPTEDGKYQRIVRYLIGILSDQLENTNAINSIISESGIGIPSSTYGPIEYYPGIWRDYPTPLGGGIDQADSFYGRLSGAYAEVSRIAGNEAKLVKQFKRFRLTGDIIDGPFIMNETCQKQGDHAITGVIYGFTSDENFDYVDVEVTAGAFQVGDFLVGATNSTTAQIAAIENRVQVAKLIGDFDQNVSFKGYTSDATATVGEFIKAEAAVLQNTGGKLTVDTETLNGVFETTSVIYAENSEQYLDVSKFSGLDVTVGQRIVSDGHTRFGVNVLQGLDNFSVGNRIYKIINGIQDVNTYAIITEVDLDNNYI